MATYELSTATCLVRSVLSVKATYLLCRWNKLLRFSVVDVISYGEKFQANLDISR